MNFTAQYSSNSNTTDDPQTKYKEYTANQKIMFFFLPLHSLAISVMTVNICESISGGDH